MNKEFYSQDKNQRNSFRGCSKLWRIRIGEEMSSAYSEIEFKNPDRRETV
jgi:hypothetical protein